MYHERQHLQYCLKHTINNLLQCGAFTTPTLNQLSDSIQASRTWFLGNYDANLLVVALQQHGLEIQWHDSRDTQLTAINLEACSMLQHIQHGQSKCQQQQHQENCEAEQQQQQGDCAEQELNGRAVPQQHWQRQHNEDSLQVCAAQQQQTAASTTATPHGNEQQQHTTTAAARGTSKCKSSNSTVLFGIVLNVKGHGPWAWLMGGRHWLAIKFMQGQWWNLDSRLSAPRSFVTSEDDRVDGGAANLQGFLRQQLAAGAHILLVVRACSN